VGFVADQSIERVRDYYEARGESEWHRLALPFDGAIEREVHRRTFERWLPAPPARVLDLGGGPGRWTIWLAERGHRVVLADLSPRMLEIAHREIAEAHVEDGVEDVLEADARDLSRWPSESFAAVVALGPYYHLVSSADRERAAAECRRVLHPGGRLFATVMPRYACAIQQLLNSGSGAIPRAGAVLREGTHRPAEAGALTEAFLFRTEDVAPFFEARGFQTEALVASEGFLALVQQQVAELRERDEAAYEALLEIAAEAAGDPSILGLSGHLLYVGRAA
jgi:ubiquinone/menaquinone biosynthesis C-methylase UbiE